MSYVIYSSNNQQFKQMATKQGLWGEAFKDYLAAVPKSFYEVRAVSTDDEVEAEIKKFDLDTAYIVLNDADEIVTFTIEEPVAPAAKSPVEKFDGVKEPRKTAQYAFTAYELIYANDENGKNAYEQLINLLDKDAIKQNFQQLIYAASSHKTLAKIKSNSDVKKYLDEKANKISRPFAEILLINDHGQVKVYAVIDPSIQLLRERATSLNDAGKQIEAFITKMQELLDAGKLSGHDQSSIARSAIRVIDRAKNVAEIIQKHSKPDGQQKYEIDDSLKAFNKACHNFDAQVAKTPILKEIAAGLIGGITLMLVFIAVCVPFVLATTSITATLLLGLAIKVGLVGLSFGSFLGATVIPDRFDFFKVDSDRKKLYSAGQELIDNINKQGEIVEARNALTLKSP